MFSIGEVDVRGLGRFENMLGALGQQAPGAVARALNRTGDMARTQVVKTLAAQTGLPQKTIRASVRVRRASMGSASGTNRDLTYTLTSAGGDVSLKYFKKRETNEGVRAYLGDARGEELFEEAFFKGGRWPRPRRTISWSNGRAFVRRGGRSDLEEVKSGVFIPEEMVSGATRDAFEASVAQNLPRRLDHEISRLLGL
ncbi:phage tail protein [Pararhodobacter sp. CCB-MM2]|uniref:phage tail protein n=1 Tax=Pararhodobacter sp. CCB-MM2 TaxID=1786003 RepID=UPI000829C453|nr:phage tail protein [Pararhodobacter sp. CCB-MM2]